MDIPALKQQARALEQQGSVGEALDVYRQVLADLDAIGGIRQELPLLIKIGDLLSKSGDNDSAVEMYERAAGEYALQGAAQPVISLCVKILRADPQETGAYLRLARRLLDAGHIEGARQVLMDYAQRGKLDKTRAGLERLAGRPDAEVRRLLDKAIFSAERRLPERPPRRGRGAAPAAPPVPQEKPAPPTEEPDEEPDEEPEREPGPPGPPKKRLTVPVGALDAEPTPDLLQTNPPETRPEAAFPTAGELTASQELRPPRESRPQDAFPTAEDLQAPVLPSPTPPAPPAPPSPPPAGPPPPPIGVEPPRPPEPLGIDTSLAPLPRGSEPALERPELPPEEESWSPGHEGARHEAPPPPEPPAPRPPRVSRPQPHPPPRPSRAARTSAAVRAPVRSSRGAPGWLWPAIVLLVLGGGGGVLVWRGIIPLERLRHPFGERGRPTPPAQAPARQRPRGDSVMARDTAGFARRTPTPPAPEAPFAPTLVLPRVPPTLPAGVTLTHPVYVVQGLRVESVATDSAGDYTIVQVLPSGQRVVLQESPSNSTVAGEIGVTGLPPDTVVGHTGIGGLAVVLKGVLAEDIVVQLLQRLVAIRP